MKVKLGRNGGFTVRLSVGAIVTLLVVAMLSLTLMSCGEESGDKAEDKGKVTIGWIPWDECVAATYLWKAILEDEGYEVELTQLDVAPVYSGMASGDIDLFLDGWLPVTHEDYWNEFGDSIEDLAVWYDKGTLELSVPAYVEDVNSIADLVGKADLFGGKIVGIEPGAGLMRLTREAVMPGYGLEGEYELLEGSTPAMLAELDRAIDRQEPVVVTLWHPHWAYAAHDLKDLEDPQGLFGANENMHALARDGFSDDFPEVAEWISNFEMSDEALAALEMLVIEDYGTGREEEAVEAWLSEPENRELVDSWLK